MTAPRIRVLVVDDSAFARKVLREVLDENWRLEVVGYARDGLDALEKIAELAPDVVTLDLVMPELDGLGVMMALASVPSPPRVVLVTVAGEDSELGVAALAAGAFDVVYKPTAMATDRLYELRAELVRKVVAAGEARVTGVLRATPPQRKSQLPRLVGNTRLVVIGASTGGPRAISEIVWALPHELPVPVVVVLHMPPGYTDAYARRVGALAQVPVREAQEGMRLGPGTVTVARAGVQLRVAGHVDGGFVARVGGGPDGSLHCPSVDVLFTSAAPWGAGVLAVVLTGMGQDGLEGARAIHAAGGTILAEAASTCVVHGMPRAISEAGLAAEDVPLHAMAQAILSRL